ncbi:MAG: hypothetical protein ACI4R9_08655 [Kiritimatiellia bacterium]
MQRNYLAGAWCALIAVCLSPRATAEVAFNYSWLGIATNQTYSSYAREGASSGIVYANGQMALAGSFVLQPDGLAGAPIAGFTGDGDPGKYVKLTTNADGYYELSVTPGNSSTVYSQTSTLKATAGRHRFSLLMRRGDGGSGSQLMKYAGVVIDGATTLTVTNDTVTYSTGPIRNAFVGGDGFGNPVSASIWSENSSDLTSDPEDVLAKVEADATAMYPIDETSTVSWSNLDDTALPKATHFTKGSGALKLLLTPLPGVATGQRVIVKSVKIINNSSKAMQSTMTINGAISDAKTVETIDDITGSANGASYTFNSLVTYAFPVGRRPVVTVGTEYPITTPGDNQMSAIQDPDSPIQITGLSDSWSGFNAYCAVEGLAANLPTAMVSAINAIPGEGFAGGTVTAEFSQIDAGSYAAETLEFHLGFDGIAAQIAGVRTDLQVVFQLPADTFPAGRVYRGRLVMTYPDGEIELSPVTVYGGEQMFLTEGNWVNETSTTLGATGAWTAGGATRHRDFIEIDREGGEKFVPIDSPDYVAGCDSAFTVRMEADEAFPATDAAPGAAVQGAVRIAGAQGALYVQAFADDVWQNLCAATAGAVYEVKVVFHYAKTADEHDSVTYTCAGHTITGARRTDEITAVKEVVVTDGTRLAALTGERQLDKAIIVEVEILPGMQKDLAAQDEISATAEVERMVIAIGEAVAGALPTDEAKAAYRAYLRVIARPKAEGGYEAQVVFTDDADKLQELQDDIAAAVKAVVANFSADSVDTPGRPGLYYGVVHGGEPGNLDARGELSLAGSDGRVRIVVPKPADGVNRQFYRIICSPNAE